MLNELTEFVYYRSLPMKLPFYNTKKYHNAVNNFWWSSLRPLHTGKPWTSMSAFASSTSSTFGDDSDYNPDFLSFQEDVGVKTCATVAQVYGEFTELDHRLDVLLPKVHWEGGVRYDNIADVKKIHQRLKIKRNNY